MGNYSIKELEKLSGIKAHTIRIWEKRYGIVAPDRSDTNIRSYSDDDLKRILNVSLLNNHGVKISKIARLSDDELGKEVSALTENEPSSALFIDQLVITMVELDEPGFAKVLGTMIDKMGLEAAVTDVLYPFLEKIGVLWLTRHIIPAQEHFVSNLIRQKIMVAIDALPWAGKKEPGIVLFLPDEELHDIGLLLAHYVCKASGFRTWYLGQMVPYSDVISVAATYQPAAMVTCLVNNSTRTPAAEYLSKLCKDQPRTAILATGRLVKDLPKGLPGNLHSFSDLTQLKSILKTLKKGR